MAKVTKIVAQQKNQDRCNLYIDEEFFAGISKRLVYDGHVKVGDEISVEKLEELIFETDKDKCRDYAMQYYIKYYPSKRQLIDKLYDKGYSKAIIEYAIDRLIHVGYLDDAVLAKDILNHFKKKCGEYKIREKLYQKKIEEDIIEKVLQGFENKEVAVEIAKKRSGNLDLTEQKNIYKLSRYLQSSGFKWDEINYAIKVIKEEG